MTSCGVQTKSSTTDYLDGSFISGTSCTGENGGGASGVYAWAQCCTFPASYNVQCSNVVGAESVTLSQITCTGNTVLTGCSSHGAGDDTDGAWIGSTYPSSSTRNTLLNTNNLCNANDGSPGSWGVTAGARCCESLSVGHTLDCMYIVSSNSETGSGDMTSVSCPSGYSMTGCSGVSGVVTERNVNAWYIQNNICYARNSRYGEYVIAMAICCQIVTAAPTLIPTYSPTFMPTNVPTNVPTFDPTFVPTFDPTFDPTNDPTSDPSKDPTSEPTIHPTSNPTLNTTNMPTTEPTEDKSAPVATQIITTSYDQHSDSDLNQNDDSTNLVNLIIYIAAALIFLCLFIAIIFYIKKKQKKRKKEAMSIQKNEKIHSSSSTGSPVIAQNTTLKTEMVVISNMDDNTISDELKYFLKSNNLFTTDLYQKLFQNNIDLDSLTNDIKETEIDSLCEELNICFADRIKMRKLWRLINENSNFDKITIEGGNDGNDGNWHTPVMQQLEDDMIVNDVNETYMIQKQEDDDILIVNDVNETCVTPPVMTQHDNKDQNVVDWVNDVTIR